MLRLFWNISSAAAGKLSKGADSLREKVELRRLTFLN
jgi:hypothetical protein